MEFLPNNSFFQQEPVVFFSAGPPNHGFHRGHGFQDRQYRAGTRGNRSNDWMAFATKLAFVVLGLYAMLMAARFFFFLVAILFSPPVLLLCLFTLVLSNNNNTSWSFPSFNHFNSREFQRCFNNPRRFRRFFVGPRPRRTGGCGPARYSTGPTNVTPNPSTPDSATASPTPAAATATQNTNSTATEQNTTSENSPRSTQNPSPTQDFELVSPFDLIMAAATAGAGGTNNNSDSPNTANTPPTSSTLSEQQHQVANDDDNDHVQPRLTKVPVHRTETEQALIVSMDISGFDPSLLQVTIENSFTLCVRGERTNKIGDRFVLEENLDLNPEVFDMDSVKADASDGVLQIKIEKKAAPQPRVISIDTTDKKTD